MDAQALQDRLSRGMGLAARRIGQVHDLHRPDGAVRPVRADTRVLRLHAAFSAEEPRFARPQGYGRALWWATLDGAAVRPGDYLRGPSGTFFVAAAQPLLPVLAVRTNRTLSASRPAAPLATGVNDYGGLVAATATTLLTGWPASVLAAGGGGPGPLPGDARQAWWTVLLPPLPRAAGVVLRASDLLGDDEGRSFVIASAEESELGWRLVAKQAAT